jgi:hypothetical protein
VDLKKTFCKSIITSPIPNSTADKTRKKKVKDKRFILSKTNPTEITIIYNVIQSNSAVNNKCSALQTLKISDELCNNYIGTKLVVDILKTPWPLVPGEVLPPSSAMTINFFFNFGLLCGGHEYINTA